MEDAQRGTDAVLITDAARSSDEEFAVRKRRYIVMMVIRLPFMLAAFAFYQIPWLAVLLLVLSLPLPWMAVLLANDRPPKKSESVNWYKGERRELEQRDHPVIEG